MPRDPFLWLLWVIFTPVFAVLSILTVVAFFLSPLTLTIELVSSIRESRQNRQRWRNTATLPANEQHRRFAKHVAELGFMPRPAADGRPTASVTSADDARRIRTTSPVPVQQSKSPESYLLRPGAPRVPQGHSAWAELEPELQRLVREANPATGRRDARGRFGGSSAATPIRGGGKDH